MALEQFASLGEIVASLAVVASLIYVAKQLRQNSDMMRAAASSARVQRDADLGFRISDSQEFTEIWLKGGASFDSLGEVEQTRLLFFSRTAILHWHNMFRLRSEKLLSDADWNELIWLIERIGMRQDTLAAWKVFKDSFDESFQEFLENHFAKAVPLS